MERATADVRIGNHHFRLIVQEQSNGIYSTDVFDLDSQINVAGSGPESTLIKQTFEGAKDEAETELCIYIQTIEEQWPRGLRVDWVDVRQVVKSLVTG